MAAENQPREVWKVQEERQGRRGAKELRYLVNVWI